MRNVILLNFVSSAIAAGTLDFALLKQGKSQLKPHFSRRDAFDTSVFTTDGLAYFLNISVGTPGQLQAVQLDTGSSDLFVTSSTAAYCQTNACEGGTFDFSKSSTSEIVAPDVFNITFGDGSMDDGDLISDVVQVRDRVITNVRQAEGTQLRLLLHFTRNVQGMCFSKTPPRTASRGVEYTCSAWTWYYRLLIWSNHANILLL
jgi:hypothetical protein